MTTSGSAVERGLPVAIPGSVDVGTLPAQIHDLLEDAIIQGVFAPGERLHTDRLAARYGVSRIPVREALRSLHEAGWVDIRPRYGAYVRERSETELNELFQARGVIESAIAQWAAERRSPADIEALHEVVDRSKRALERGDDAALDRSSADFYAAMREAAGNHVLGTLAADLQKRARFYFHMVAHDLESDWVSLHEQLAGFVEHGDAQAAAELARRHVLETGEAVARLLRAQADQAPVTP